MEYDKRVGRKEWHRETALSYPQSTALLTVFLWQGKVERGDLSWGVGEEKFISLSVEMSLLFF